MKRLGALVGVVAMVAAAIFVRGEFGDDADDPDGRDNGGERTGLLCPRELADVCAVVSSDVATAVAGVTADTLIDATDTDALPGEAWIVPAAWARVVLAERQRLGNAPIFEIDDGSIASAPVMIVIWGDRAAALETACGEPVGWRCLAERSGEPVLGNPVRAGTPDVDSATGLTIAAAQAAGILGVSDFAANDFDGDFRTLAAGLAEHQRDDPVRVMRSRGPGELTAAGALELRDHSLSSTFGTIVADADRTPMVRADIVALVPTGQSLANGTRDGLTTAFVDAGWDAPGTGPDGLPAGGVLAALRTLWNDSR